LTRSFVRTTLMALVLMGLVCGLPFYVTFSPSWEDRAYEFPNDDGDFRVRVIEADGLVCAELKQEMPHSDVYPPWTRRGVDCAWPAVAGSAAWLAGGQSYQINDSSGNTVATPNWLFFGIVPGTATEVRLTLSSGATLRIPTEPAGKGRLRVYGHQELNAGDQITVTGVQLRDASGGEIRVL
jgi:hypothetical protein